MSDTPRTDAELWIAHDGRSSVGVVEADFARQLERELAKARKDAFLAERAIEIALNLLQKIEDAARNEKKLSRYWLDEIEEVKAELVLCLEVQDLPPSESTSSPPEKG